MKRGMVDRIVASVMVIFVVMFLSIFLYTTIFSGIISSQSVELRTYETDYNKLLLESILISQEGTTGMTYERMLVEAIKALSTNILFNGQEISVEDEFSSVLDELLGPDKYYLTITPATLGVSVSYVLDGSPTMSGPREEVQAPLLQLIQDLQSEDLFGEDASLYFHIYILSTNESYCDYYNNDMPAEYDDIVSCETIGGEPFYASLSTMQYDPAYLPPYPEPFASYEQWLSSDHYSPTTFFSDSDWASGIAYASLKYRADPIERTSTNGHVVITVVDEMTTGSKGDECFVISEADPFDVSICLLCDNTCPEERSERLINQSADILEAGNDLFIGFHVFPTGGEVCNFNYNNDAYYDTAISEYICQFTSAEICDSWSDCVPSVDPPENPDVWCTRSNPPPGCECYNYVSPPADTHWCREPLCGGCTNSTPLSEDYCFHQDCNTFITEDLNQIASVTGGQTLYLADQAQLLDVIRTFYTDQIANFDFEIGTLNRSRERYVVEEEILLALDKPIEISFWVYE